MTRPFILGLTGPAGAGKSTVAAAVLAASGGGRTLHIGFGLKAMLAGFYAALGLEPVEITRRVDGDLKRTPCPHLCGQTPTRAQQTLGTEWGRELIGADLWLAAWRAEAVRRLAAGEIVINDSVRFENEAQATRDLGGLVVGLTGRRDERVTAVFHPSESGLRPDLWVDNAGSVERTAREVLAAVARHDG